MTHLWAIALNTALSGSVGLSLGKYWFPAGRALDRAYRDGWDAYRRSRLPDRLDEVWREGYEQGADDEARSFTPCERKHADDTLMPGAGMRRGDPVRSPELPQALVPGPETGQERGLPDLGQRSGGGEPGSQSGEGPGDRLDDAPEAADWADELTAMRTQIAVDEATEVLEAVEPPPPPGSFEYYLSDWQRDFDKKMAGWLGDIADCKRKLNIS